MTKWSVYYRKNDGNPISLQERAYKETTYTVNTRYRHTPGTPKKCACIVIVPVTRPRDTGTFVRSPMADVPVSRESQNFALEIDITAFVLISARLVWMNCESPPPNLLDTGTYGYFVCLYRGVPVPVSETIWRGKVGTPEKCACIVTVLVSSMTVSSIYCTS